MVNDIFLFEDILYLNSKYFEYFEYFDILILIILKRFIYERLNQIIIFIENIAILKFTINFHLCKF